MRQNATYQTRLAVQENNRGPSVGRKTDSRTSVQKRIKPTFRPKRPVGKMALFGALSLSAYFMLFTNEKLVVQTFTLGGWHAAFPVLTAFFFSFIHGAFASNLLSVLGIEAKK